MGRSHRKNSINICPSSRVQNEAWWFIIFKIGLKFILTEVKIKCLGKRGKGRVGVDRVQSFNSNAEKYRLGRGEGDSEHWLFKKSLSSLLYKLSLVSRTSNFLCTYRMLRIWEEKEWLVLRMCSAILEDFGLCFVSFKCSLSLVLIFLPVYIYFTVGFSLHSMS